MADNPRHRTHCVHGTILNSLGALTQLLPLTFRKGPWGMDIRSDLSHGWFYQPGSWTWPSGCPLHHLASWILMKLLLFMHRASQCSHPEMSAVSLKNDVETSNLERWQFSLYSHKNSIQKARRQLIPLWELKLWRDAGTATGVAKWLTEKNESHTQRLNQPIALSNLHSLCFPPALK